MASVQDHDDLVRVGPGTVMGEMMRQYWIPAMLSEELKRDGDPVRLMLLCEKLIAFRDSSGRVGIMDHRCPHRCASLFFGRNEEDGIRCIYHGWKYDTEGNCVEMPNMVDRPDFRRSVKAKAYKTHESNGLIWVYMGSRADAPPLPMIEATFVPEGERTVEMYHRECNWLQSLEGDIDTSHVGFLHMGSIKADDLPPNHPMRPTVVNRAPAYKVADTQWGTMYGAHRLDTDGRMSWRVAHFGFPFWTHTPNIDITKRVVAKACVPIDDENCMTFAVFGAKEGRRSSSNLAMKNGYVMPGALPPDAKNTIELLPNTPDWHGRFRTVASARNNYLIDRDQQRRNIIYSGIHNLTVQDQAVVESMGAISDHAFEHLAASDQMIVRTRRRLLEAARALRNDGVLPPGVDDPEIYWGARSGTYHAPPDQDWIAAFDNVVKTVNRWPRPGEAQAAE